MCVSTRISIHTHYIYNVLWYTADGRVFRISISATERATVLGSLVDEIRRISSIDISDKKNEKKKISRFLVRKFVEFSFSPNKKKYVCLTELRTVYFP